MSLTSALLLGLIVERKETCSATTADTGLASEGFPGRANVRFTMASEATGKAIARVGPRRLAEAIMSPSSLLVAGAVGGLAVAATGPIGLVVGVGAWLVSTVFKLRRPSLAMGSSQATRIDPFAVSEPWRQHVQSALAAKLRFDRLVQSTPNGPLKERLRSVANRVDEGVDEVWTIAQRGHRLASSIDDLRINQVRTELRNAESAIQRNSDSSRAGTLQSTRDSLRSQLDSAERLAAKGLSTIDRLRELDAKLDELVARGTELSIAGSDDAFEDLRSDVDAVVTEMEALRRGMEETSAIERGTATT